MRIHHDIAVNATKWKDTTFLANIELLISHSNVWLKSSE